MERRALYLFCAAVGVAGLILSIYLTYVSALPYCPPELSGCDVVIASEYSKFFGVPVALLGAAWFAVVIALSIASYISERCRKPLLAWCIIGVLGVLYLVWVEVFILHAICLYCTIAHVFGVAITVMASVAARS